MSFHDRNKETGVHVITLPVQKQNIIIYIFSKSVNFVLSVVIHCANLSALSLQEYTQVTTH